MNTKKAYINISEKYTGDHPVAELHHYEGLLVDKLGEKGYEAQIVNWYFTDKFIIIEYY